MNSETGRANPSDPKVAKVPALPEDDLAHFEALVDRMLRDRAEANFPSPSAPEKLVDAPRITVSHPAEFFAAERRIEEPATVVAQPWHVRHARKLIGTGVLVVGAGTAYVAYTNGWRFPADQVKTAAPAAPAAPAPTTVQRPITPTPPATAPVAEVPASATVRAATPPQPAAAARKPAATPRPSAPAPAPTASAGSRPPAVTHTLREAAPVPVSAAPAVAAAPQPAAAPSDCPENIAALGLCASRMSKGTK